MVQSAVINEAIVFITALSLRAVIRRTPVAVDVEREDAESFRRHRLAASNRRGVQK